MRCLKRFPVPLAIDAPDQTRLQYPGSMATVASPTSSNITMLHHLSIGVRDLDLAGRFYDAALGALGYRRVFEDDTAIGYGVIDDEDLLCLKLRDDAQPPGAGFHIAFSASSRAAVDAFHAAALKIGGLDHGVPGLRPDYGDHYYAAFLVDPDGHRIEAVINAPAP